MKIRTAVVHDAPFLAELPPLEWYIKLDELFLYHMKSKYFYAVVVELDGEIAGFGNIIIHNDTAWFGNIVVKKQFRRQKVATALMEYLQHYLDDLEINTRILIATREGKELYKTLGFIESGEYNFFRGKTKSMDDTNITPVTTEDYNAIMNLDRTVTGEHRSVFLKQFIEQGFVYKKDGKIEGYSIPEAGSGPIYALTDEAGLSLLSHKHYKKNCASVVPAANKTALTLFNKNKFELFGEAVRMYHGKDTDWKPDKVFSRLFAYSG